MNQDSEQNRPNRDADSRPESRRDGSTGRSFGRRDDARNDAPRSSDSRSGDSRSGYSRTSGPRNNDRNDDRPRFSRDNGSRGGDSRSSDSRSGYSRPQRANDRPGFNRDSNDRDRPGTGDRPRFNREGDSSFRSRSNESRGNSDRSGGPRNDGPSPRFSRDNNNRSDGPRNGGPRSDAPRNERSSGFNDRRRDDRPGSGESRPRFERNSGSTDDRPRFNRDNRSDDRPRRDNTTDRFGSERRFSERSDGPRNNAAAGSRPSFGRDRDESRPRFDRNDGPRNDGPRNDGPRRNDADRPRFDRKDENNRSERPRFSRDRADDRSDKPAFKRVGGFNREADERNNGRAGSDGPFRSTPDRPRFNDRDRDNTGDRPDRRNSRTDDTRFEDRKGDPSRFSGDQRKASGDRRTGRYDKAPNYNLELERQRTSGSYNRPRTGSPAGGRGNRPTSGQDEKTNLSSTEGRNQPNESGLTRLNRYIANSGVCSRREADELIARGDISVNGKVVTEMGYKVKENDTVRYGTKVLNPERFVYVLLNKPKDYITTTDDPEERKTVMELVADAGNFRMYPVGRLDRNTTGLLLLTNDGELADKLTHPSNNIRKIYQIELDKPITTEHFEAIQKGVELEDGVIKPDALSIITPDAYVVGIEIHSGRNRIVRRMFEHFGYEVNKLDRTTYAGLTKKELPRGKWRFLDPKEVVKLKYFN